MSTEPDLFSPLPDPERVQAMAAGLRAVSEAFAPTAEMLATFTRAANRLAAALESQAPPTPKAARRAAPSIATADAFPSDLSPDLAPVAEAVYEVLYTLTGELAAAHPRATILEPTRAGVGRAVRDYPQKSHLQTARDYAAWATGPRARRPHRDVVLGWRNWIGREADTARPAHGSGTARGHLAAFDR